MRWDRGPASFIPLELGCQQRPSLYACVPVCVYKSLSSVLIPSRRIRLHLHGIHMVTHTAYTLPTAVSGYPVPNPKVCKQGLSHSESGVGPEVWLKPVYLGLRGWNLHHYCLASGHKGSGDALSEVLRPQPMSGTPYCYGNLCQRWVDRPDKS